MLVERPEWIEFEFFDMEKHAIKIKSEGMVGRICMQEIEHLDGVLIGEKAKEKVKFKEIENEKDFMKFVEKNVNYLDLLRI